MKKLLYFLFLSFLVMACAKDQESIEPATETEAVEQITQLLVNVSFNEREHHDCSGSCNTKAPIANAIVSLTANTAEEDLTFESLTSAGGFAIFRDIPGNIYNLKVSSDYGEKTVKVNVEEKKRVTVDIGF